MQFSDFPANTYYSFHGISYGSQDNDFFKLGDLVFEVTCDPDDGYLSYLDEVKLLDSCDLHFFKHPLALVHIVQSEDLYYLVDSNNHTWLTFGTDYSDDYYPTYVFHYSPIEDIAPTNLPKLCPFEVSPEIFI